MNTLWRQGDLIIQAIPALPEQLVPQRRPILAMSDATGHKHQIRDHKAAILYKPKLRARQPEEMFLEVLAEEARLAHPEHEAILLPRGVYRIWQQREFSLSGPRVVRD